MERYEMAELLSQKAGVSLEEARAALEENNWDMLDAMVALERARRADSPEIDIDMDKDTGPVRRVKNVSDKHDPFFSNGFAVMWGYVKKLFNISLENDFVVIRRDKQLLAVPVLVLAVLLLASFGLMLVVLFGGLFCGCQYRFAGRHLGRDDINGAMDRMSHMAEDIKESFQEHMDGDNDGNE